MGRSAPAWTQFYYDNTDEGAPAWSELSDDFMYDQVRGDKEAKHEQKWTVMTEAKETEVALSEQDVRIPHLKAEYEVPEPEAKDHLPFEGGGVREAQGDRPRFELLIPKDVPYERQLLTRCAVHMAKGANKYAERNWEQFSDEAALERAKSSALRHLMQWITGEDDGEDHAAAVVFNLMAGEHVRSKLEGKN